MSTMVTHPQDLRQYQGRFTVVREGDQYAAILPTAAEYEPKTYHRSARRVYAVLEPVPGTSARRIDMTAAEARAIIEAMQTAGRAPAGNVSDQGEGRWEYWVEAAANPANGTREEELAQYRIAHNLRREIARRGRGRVSGAVTHQPREYKAGEAF